MELHFIFFFKLEVNLNISLKIIDHLDFGPFNYFFNSFLYAVLSYLSFFKSI